MVSMEFTELHLLWFIHVPYEYTHYINTKPLKSYKLEFGSLYNSKAVKIMFSAQPIYTIF
jgi:hypothetical protein